MFNCQRVKIEFGAPQTALNKFFVPPVLSFAADFCEYLRIQDCGKCTSLSWIQIFGKLSHKSKSFYCTLYTVDEAHAFVMLIWPKSKCTYLLYTQIVHYCTNPHHSTRVLQNRLIGKQCSTLRATPSAYNTIAHSL